MTQRELTLRHWFIVIVLLLAACGRNPEQSESTFEALPTRVPSPTPEYNNIYDAEGVARTFLYLWEQGNFEEMYSMLTPSARDATDYDTFLATYAGVYDEIRLSDLRYQLVAQARQGNQVMVFNYNMTFTSDIVGTFTDEGRELRLVLQDDVQAWRGAWSPGDIFTEMQSGAQVRLDVFQPTRANIYDRDGVILADMNGRIVVVRVIRNEIPDTERCISTLSGALDLPADEVIARLQNSGPDWLAEIGIIEAETYRQWQGPLESDCDAQFDNRTTRRYLDGELAAHIIGLVGFPSEDEVEAIEDAGFRRDSILGQSGIEATWDETLRGKPGGQLTLVTPNGDRLRLLAERGTEPPQSVYLTLDSELQRFILSTMREDQSIWGEQNEGAAAVVLDVNTGAVLAMVSYPTYDANAFLPYPVMGRTAGQRIVRQMEADPARPLLNRAAQGRYPSGSIMKSVTAIAALDSGVYALDERYYSIGVWNRDINRYDWRAGGHGSLTLSGALTHSCNTCFYEAGYRLNETDPYLLPDYANLLGLGVPTGMTDIPTSDGLIGTPELKPLLAPNENPWSFSDAVNLAIGQGFIEISPLQIARAYAVIANGGTLYRPQLVDHVALLDESSYHMVPDPMVETGIRPEVLQSIRDGLCAVTTESYGTAEFVFRNSELQEIGVCGKTGTATVRAGDSLPHAWFVGYAPRDNPQIVVAVVVENAGEGSEVGAPLVRKIMEYYFLQGRLEF